MKTSRRKSRATTPTPTPAPTPHRCSHCGRAVSLSHGEPTNVAPSWRRCDDCRGRAPDQLGTEMLAACGIEHDPDDEAVKALLRDPGWLARHSRGATVTDTEDDARANMLGGVTERHPKPDPWARPWQHVDPREVRRELARLRGELDAADRVTRCRDGVCGCCGVRTSQAWHGPIAFGAAGGLSGERPPRWPVCAVCWAHLIAAGGDPISDRARRRWTAIVLGKPASPPQLSVPPLVKPYARFVAPGTRATEAEGTDAAWSWVSDDDRAKLVSMAPNLRPDDVLAREARAAAATARLRATRAAEASRSALVLGDQ